MPLQYFLYISLAFNIILFLIAYKLKTDKLTDLSYSLTFIILITIAFLTSNKTLPKTILFLLTVVWALRLGIFLFIRIRKINKDKRFDGIREKFFSFFFFWFIQGLTAFIILIPSFILLNTNILITLLSIIGLIISISGLLIETLADFQKYNFNLKNKNNFIKTGLWKYSRHPNYFGEILVWIGIYLFGFNSFSTIEKLYTLIGPLSIIIILVFFSGLPPLEKSANKKFGKLKEYKEYKNKTPILIPFLNFKTQNS